VARVRHPSEPPEALVTRLTLYVSVDKGTTRASVWWFQGTWKEFSRGGKLLGRVRWDKGLEDPRTAILAAYDALREADAQLKKAQGTK
jgi:hypothetical protein